MSEDTAIKLFEEKKIRSVWDEKSGEWYFSIVDIIGALTDSVNSKDYFKKLRKRDTELDAYVGTNCPLVSMLTETGKHRQTLAGNAKNILRIVQSIPSPKAEPFKIWLAEIGYERLQEIENPELAQERMKSLYEQKGYPKDWIDKRLRGIAIRQGLTDEWKERGITRESDYAILTSEISKAAFGLTPSEYKTLKGLDKKKNENLRDHMTDLELIFTMLGERVTTEISQNEKPSGFEKNKNVARRGGNVAGVARNEAEKEIGKSIVTSENYLDIKKNKKLNK